MHNHYDKYPERPGFEPGTSRLPASVDTNEPSGKISAWSAKYLRLMAKMIYCPLTPLIPSFLPVFLANHKEGTSFIDF